MAIKSSSRAGRFKKKLVSPEVLLMDAGPLETKFSPLIKIYEQKQISEAEFTAVYLIITLSHRFPDTWPGSNRKPLDISHNLKTPIDQLPFSFTSKAQKRIQGISNLGDLISNFAFKSTPETVHRALLLWSNGSYQLKLMFKIPTPTEVLNQQKYAQRCVSVFTKQSELKNYILGERDALSFTMHDLIHADHFYSNDSHFQGQLGFYGLLDHCLAQEHFKDHLKLARFKSEFEYLISDMNAYAIHLFKCLKSALIFYHPSDGLSFFDKWTSLITNDQPTKEALIRLNTPAYDPVCYDQIILNFLATYKN